MKILIRVMLYLKAKNKITRFEIKILKRKII